MADIFVTGIPDDILAALEQRAEVNGRDLQQELLCIIEESARAYDRRVASRSADDIRERLTATGRTFLDSSALVRQDRDR